MHNLLRCRRGSAAFVTVVALVPLIGVVALGSEAASWYVTKQHAQNAADAAAISGALRLTCSPGNINCDSAQDYVYRGKQFADQNKFCDPRDTSSSYVCANSPPTGTTQTVKIEQPTSTRVSASITQRQPVYLVKVLGLFPDGFVDIGAQAIAEIKKPKELCALGLGRYPSSQSALTIGGSVTNTGTGCGMQSNDTVKYASTPSFTGSGWAVYGANGCVNSGNCDPGVPYNYYMPPATNPLQLLDTESSLNTRTGNTSPSCPLRADGYKHCTPNSSGAYGNFPTVSTGDKYFLDPGTYFFRTRPVRAALR
jgi:hypothetical protein